MTSNRDVIFQVFGRFLQECCYELWSQSKTSSTGPVTLNSGAEKGQLEDIGNVSKLTL